MAEKKLDFTVKFNHKKSTSGTEVYEEEGDNPKIGTLYIKKGTINGERPDAITVSVKAN